MENLQFSKEHTTTRKYQNLKELQVVNLPQKHLPIQENPINNVHRVIGFNYSYVKPAIYQNPKLIALSQGALQLIDLNENDIKNNSEQFSPYFSGASLLDGSKPVAHCYCGHQFGVWANQLGDGRAITLGHYFNSKNQPWEIQLKGCGKTPYSRMADGKAVLRSSIREFLCSENMHGLGIPTTRAASIAVVDEQAIRDPLYNGKGIEQICAVVMRLAPSFVRFGSFEIYNPPFSNKEGGPSHKIKDQMLPKFLDYVISYFFSNQIPNHTQSHDKVQNYRKFFEIVTVRTAEMVALWQTVGFCHGVLNTDNMSILGLTIDYGPFGFIEHFDKKHICNHSDDTGHYNYENQPKVCQWNLLKLAQALDPVVPLEYTKAFLVENYDKIYETIYYTKLRNQIGIINQQQKLDFQLINDLFTTMDKAGSEFTNTFRIIQEVELPTQYFEELDKNDLIVVQRLSALSPNPTVIKNRLKSQFKPDQLKNLIEIANQNPAILRGMGIDINYLLAEQKKTEIYEQIKELSDDKIVESIEQSWRRWILEYKIRLLAEIQDINDETQLSDFIALRKNTMKQNNPRFVLKNYIAERVIQQAEEGDYSLLQNVLQVLQNPYEDHVIQGLEVCDQTPDWALDYCVSCSS